MARKKYYICVTPFFPSPSSWQGAYVLDQVKAIQRHSNYKVVVFKTHSLNDRQEDYEVDGVKVHAIRPLLMPSYVLNGMTEGIVGYMFVRKLRSLDICPQEVAYVHCHTANHAAFGFGIKSVNPDAKVLIQFHDLDPYTLRNGRWADKRWNVRYRAKKSLFAFNRADLLISISTPVQDNLLAFPKARKAEIYQSYLDRLNQISDFPKMCPKKTYVLYNGVDTRIFNEGIEDNDLEESDIFRIGCIANFQELKDHMTLIKAFNILCEKGYKNIILSLLGNGKMRSTCEKYLQEHELQKYVEWPQEVSHDKLSKYYHSLDLFVLPSYYEGFGCVYTEAHACGIPFMGCYDQGAAECISPIERDQWLVNPHDYEQLAKLIERQYKERNKQHLCQPYDIEELIKKYLEYLNTI